MIAEGNTSSWQFEGNRLKYRYVGESVEQWGDLERKWRGHANIISEQRRAHPHQSAEYFRTLGFFAHVADFQAEVPPQSQSTFEEEYLRLVGVRPVLHQNGYVPVRIVTTYDKWGAELRIYFPERPNLDLPPEVVACAAQKPGLLRINNNDYWRQLVGVGFRLGTRHDCTRIRESIPPAFREHFDSGL